MYKLLILYDIFSHSIHFNLIKLTRLAILNNFDHQIRIRQKEYHALNKDHCKYIIPLDLQIIRSKIPLHFQNQPSNRQHQDLLIAHLGILECQWDQGNPPHKILSCLHFVKYNKPKSLNQHSKW